MMFKISASLMSTRLIKGIRLLLEIRFSRRSIRYKISMFCIPPSQQARLPLTYPFAYSLFALSNLLIYIIPADSISLSYQARLCYLSLGFAELLLQGMCNCHWEHIADITSQ